MKIQPTNKEAKNRNKDLAGSFFVFFAQIMGVIRAGIQIAFARLNKRPSHPMYAVCEPRDVGDFA